jgi:hypothetical protein
MRHAVCTNGSLLPAAGFAAIFRNAEATRSKGSGFGANDGSARTVKRDGAEARIILSLRMKVLIS